jgi:D-3-phosphoglycerate dehydrogenase / 2-oxoglutarate reductase
MGMRVIFYDVTDNLRHGNTEPTADLNDLLSLSDVVSLHVPETPATSGMIGAEEIAAMRPGAYLINNSRGTVVDLDALARVLRSGHLNGAAVDVFPLEPTRPGERFQSSLQGLPNVILTPHIGGSTVEAQARIGEEVTIKLIDYSDAGSTAGAVSFPQVQLPRRAAATRYIHIHRNEPGVLGHVNRVFSRAAAQHPRTISADGRQFGYVVVETDTDQNCDAVLNELRSLDGTIRARLIRRV